MYDITIIGAGVVGCFLARELARYQLKVLVLEKNNDVGNETSAANSAIVHSGYDPEPNSLKALLNVKGNAMFDKVCDELDVSMERIGSLTLALNEDDIPALKDLQARAKINGVETQLLNKEETKKIEPFVSDNVVASLYAPTAGIINPFELCVHLMENAIDNGVELRLNNKVTKIAKKEDYYLINDEIKTKIILNCTGVYADTINELVNEKTFTIIPRKGEYYVLNHFNEPFVTHTLFLLPSKKGKGVLISPTTSDNYLIGPSAEVVEKDDKSTDKITLNQVRATASTMVTNIPFAETIRIFAGVRPTPDTHDFIIEESKSENFINVSGIESPGLASSPAIARKVIDEIIANKIELKEKDNFNPRIRKYVKLKDLSLEEKQKLFNENPLYGRIICKCEQISEGEILDALSRSCPPRSIAGLKRRLRVGFGKCQGGMCQSYAIKILANHYGVDAKDINYDNDGSYILLKHTKEL